MFVWQLISHNKVADWQIFTNFAVSKKNNNKKITHYGKSF